MDTNVTARTVSPLLVSKKDKSEGYCILNPKAELSYVRFGDAGGEDDDGPNAKAIWEGGK